MLYEKYRKEVAFTMRRLYKQGLTTCSGGNISFRVGKNHVLITPSAPGQGGDKFQADRPDDFGRGKPLPGTETQY